MEEGLGYLLWFLKIKGLGQNDLGPNKSNLQSWIRHTRVVCQRRLSRLAVPGSWLAKWLLNILHHDDQPCFRSFLLIMIDLISLDLQDPMCTHLLYKRPQLRKNLHRQLAKRIPPLYSHFLKKRNSLKSVSRHKTTFSLSGDEYDKASQYFCERPIGHIDLIQMQRSYFPLLKTGNDLFPWKFRGLSLKERVVSEFHSNPLSLLICNHFQLNK